MNEEELRSQLEVLRQENARLAALHRHSKIQQLHEETKFNYVVAQLDTRYAAEVEDIIINPSPTERYKHFRTKLVERLSISEEQRVRQLINEEELGDRKPSQFLRHLRSLAAILTAQSELPLEKVAELADKIVEVQPAPSQFVHAVATTNEKKELHVFAAIEAFTKQVSELYAKRLQHIRSRSRSRSNVERSNGKGWCWYHSTYGKKAAKCKASCKYQVNSNDSQ
ncbi:hypothetical protein QTP88_023192 [Uroleucon formosanum]